MHSATLVRTHFGAATRARETYETETEVEVLYEGDLEGAIAAARAFPADQRAALTIQTEDAHYGPDDFDTMTPAGVPLRDLELMHGAGLVLIEKEALARLVGDGPPPAQPLAIVSEHIEAITTIVSSKLAAKHVEVVDGKRLIRITAPDIAAA